MDWECRDGGGTTKDRYLEILRFSHSARHVVFDSEGDKFRNKCIKDNITVSEAIDMECGNTRNRIS